MIQKTNPGKNRCLPPSRPLCSRGVMESALFIRPVRHDRPLPSLARYPRPSAPADLLSAAWHRARRERLRGHRGSRSAPDQPRPSLPDRSAVRAVYRHPQRDRPGTRDPDQSRKTPTVRRQHRPVEQESRPAAREHDTTRRRPTPSHPTDGDPLESKDADIAGGQLSSSSNPLPGAALFAVLLLFGAGLAFAVGLRRPDSTPEPSVIAASIDPVAPAPPRRDAGETREGHEAAVRALAVSPDGSVIFSAGGDYAAGIEGAPIGCALRQWDSVRDGLIRLFPGHCASVHCLALSPDGKQILSGGGGYRWRCARSRKIACCDCGISMMLRQNAPSLGTNRRCVVSPFCPGANVPFRAAATEPSCCGRL